MTNKRFIQEAQRGLQESIAYFSNANKPERERWVVREFLQNQGILFQENELERPKLDPPDLVFRGLNFEIKEILDPGRRRHDELKAKFERAKRTTRASQLLETFSPKDITPHEVGARVLDALTVSAKKYGPELRTRLDMMFYVNLQEHQMRAGPMPDPLPFMEGGWASVSAVLGWDGLVFSEAAGRQSLLNPLVGKIVRRKFGEQ